MHQSIMKDGKSTVTCTSVPNVTADPASSIMSPIGRPMGLVSPHNHHFPSVSEEIAIQPPSGLLSTTVHEVMNDVDCPRNT